VAAALPPPPVAPPPDADVMPLDPQTLRQVLDELDSLLAQSDAAATRLFEDHAAALRTTLGVPCDELARQIGRFDFDAALVSLRALRQSYQE